MKHQVISTSSVGSYYGAVAPAFDDPLVRQQLADLPALLSADKVERLSQGADYVVKLPLSTTTGIQIIAVKIFKRQSRVKDWYDRKKGSKAERSYRAAIYLQEHDICTPAPVAWLDRWENDRLLESYYLCLYEPAICFRDALSDIYYNQRDNEPLMNLLFAVAPAIRAMHDAGFMHGDMGNQNILLPRNLDGSWGKPLLIDLNRCTIQTQPLDDKQRAFDLSRIILPGAYLKIFKFIYCHHEDIPVSLNKWEQKFRRRFEWHTRSRKYRHPLRHWRNRHKKMTKPIYPSGQNIWLWDEKSAQPMTVLERREKNRHRDIKYVIKTAWQSLVAMRQIFKLYHRILKESYRRPISMAGRIGVALHPKTEYIMQELELLQQLGNPPVLIRFCHHETPVDWAQGIALIEQLHQQGVEIMVAFLQDRRAVLEPDNWTHFLETVISAIVDKVAHIEITHAFNRVKWGVWSAKEYAQLMQPAFAIQDKYPQIKLTGPACIDFEYHPTIAALKSLPADRKLNALSHLLYVDRRGAPEHKQGRFSTLEKCALLKALAQWSDSCDDKVIVSEVNWPVKYTGIWSPIGCPYEAPKWRREEPGETEDDYANYMLRYLAITLCSGHVEQVFWWRLSAHGYGLVDDLNNFRVRPAFSALAVFLKLIGGAKFIKKRVSESSVYMFDFESESKHITMVWQVSSAGCNHTLPKVDRILDSQGNEVENTQPSPSPLYLITDTHR
ncbi:lipopolysaccharide kinase InaA family protein [Cellvibrio sp. PSBB006]|uniref:lipopolysaccharide kinase InaA family protein n=1 Tax=Cellvibrio sp. PSBB006 TaxID=1987723 RepID=UPI001E637584|nr:lipopolysaccharide kinase InaA family protein [Cellvibrio sp. PSBB006]